MLLAPSVVESPHFLSALIGEVLKHEGTVAINYLEDGKYIL